MLEDPDNQALLISQLPELMKDQRFVRLSTITLAGGPYEFSATDIAGWQIAESWTGYSSLLDETQITILKRQ